MCPFSYVTCVCLKSGARVVVGLCALCSCVCLYGCTFSGCVFLFRFLRNKVPSQERRFSTAPLSPKSKVEVRPPQSCKSRAMKSTIHVRRHGSRSHRSTLDLGGEGEAKKLFAPRWYFISQKPDPYFDHVSEPLREGTRALLQSSPPCLRGE